jgi:hypothetical protein
LWSRWAASRSCPYLIQALRAVIREELSEDDQDNLDIWLAPMGHNEVNSHRRVRLVFMAGDRELCKIPYRGAAACGRHLSVPR